MTMRLIHFWYSTLDKYGKGRTTYLSAFIYEQFINLMAEKVIAQMINDSRAAKQYNNIYVGYTSDMSHVDQLAVRFRRSSGRKDSTFSSFIWAKNTKFEYFSSWYVKNKRNNYWKLHSYENCQYFWCILWSLRSIKRGILNGKVYPILSVAWCSKKGC